MTLVRNPPDGETEKIPAAGVRDRQRAHFDSGATLPVAVRREALERLRHLLGAREDEFLDALRRDLGKPGVEAWLAEVRFLRDELKLIERHLPRWARPRRARHPVFLLPARSHVRPTPFGVALVMAPWNYPLQLALAPAIAALAAGNCVTIKPSEHAPATADALARLIADTFDPGHATVVTGGADTSRGLLREPYDFFFFTGGETVGREVAKAAAGHLAPSVLELGGKSPAVIDASADLDFAVERVAAGKFFNAGQTCMAPDFAAVHESVRDEFTRRLIDHLRQTYRDPADLARIVHRRRYDHLLALAGDDAPPIGEDDPEALRLAPRVVSADWSHPSMREELFGPILPVVGFRETGELIGRLRGMPAPLALYLFSRNRALEQELLDAVPSGSVCLNDVMKQAINPHLPFGGVGRSGYGRYRGRFGFETFSQQRAVTRRYFVPDLFRASPPYGDLLKKLRRWL